VEDLVESIRPYTKTSPERISGWISDLEYIDRENIDGDIVECGVWRAGNIILARKLSPDRVCWLYDTFAGMTEPAQVDCKRNGAPALARYHSNIKNGVGWCIATMDDVESGLKEFGVYDESKLRFVEGDVSETLQHPKRRPEKIALLRLDTDWYASTRDELKYLYPLLQPGGVLIVDDYGHWDGARRAVNEYFGKVKLEIVDYSACRIVK
jgi:hypothetical protein